MARQVTTEDQVPRAEGVGRLDRLTGRDGDLPRARRVERLGPALVRDLYRLAPMMNSWSMGSAFETTNRTVSPGSTSMTARENAE